MKKHKFLYEKWDFGENKWLSQSFYRHRRFRHPFLLRREGSTDLPAAVKRSAENVDVYKTSARIICFVALEARWLGAGSIALKSARTLIASYVWGIYTSIEQHTAAAAAVAAAAPQPAESAARQAGQARALPTGLVGTLLLPLLLPLLQPLLQPLLLPLYVVLWLIYIYIYIFIYIYII